MDKNAIKKYAVWARRELIARVSQMALQYGITVTDCGDANAESINGEILTKAEKKQRQALIAEIKEKGFEQVMEEVAYTWFNRFSALRFMEVNGYLPSHVRVFTDEDNNFKPQIITEAIHLEMDGLDMEKVYALKDANKTDELYKYLLITQCNALSSILPGMFQRIEDFSELLFPDNLLREGSAIQQMIELIPEEDWKDAVQIIGWLYQYYNSEKKDDVFAALKKNVKITKDNIPAATQLFTPDWIVRYMVENSLGRLWIEGHPNDTLKSGWKYYLDEAEQEPDVQKQLAEIRKEYADLKPEDIKCIDPCMGSGHILVYMFDVLMQIYEAYGYSSREAVESIVKNNLYGLDIDDRAAQLANFAVMMKARQYDRRFFSRGIYPHVYAIQESNGVHISAPERLGDERKIAEKLISGLRNAKEYGSTLILDITSNELSQLRKRLEQIDEMSSNGDLLVMMEAGELIEALVPLINVAEVLVQRYTTVVTNPPYMGGKSMTVALSEYVKKNYPSEKADLFAVFIDVCDRIVQPNGYYAMITQPSLLTLLSFETVRTNLITQNTINSLIHFGRGIFGIDFGSTAFVIRKEHINNYRAEFYRPHERTFQYVDPDDICKLFLEAKNNHGFKFDFSTYNSNTADTETEIMEPKLTQIHYSSKPTDFVKIPTCPISYWVSDTFYDAFAKFKPLTEYAEPRQGMATADNNRFLRYWSEVDFQRIGFSCKNAEMAEKTGCKWFPYNKGGAYRKWYGNNDYVLNWENNGLEIKNFQGSVLRNTSYYFRSGLTWSSISAGSVSFRQSFEGFLFDSKGPVCFAKNGANEKYILAFVNSSVATYFLKILAPTMDFNQGPVGRLPLAMIDAVKEQISILADANTQLMKNDWDSFESSWDFKMHPFVRWAKGLWDCAAIGATMSKYYGDKKSKKIDSQMELCYLLWQGECSERFNQLKANEESINRSFIDIYELKNELQPKVEDKDVCVTKADLQRDMKSFISYAVGCMFGRYSLDVEGLAYAGGEWDVSKYRSFPADKDNIIPICDDEYFEDDIMGRFIEFVKVVYGADSLEANLQFIADAIGGKGSAREVIRSYFRNDFYNDHLKVYQKRPIYWLFDSGKKGGFKALIYMHRYQQDTIARMRTDYVHEQQARYRTEISDLETRIAGASTSERVKLNKQLATLQAQADEIHGYEEKIHHLADQMIRIDLDDGVKKNYEIFQDVLAKIK